MTGEQINFRADKQARQHIREIRAFYRCNQTRAILLAIAAKAAQVRWLIERGETLESVTEHAMQVMQAERQAEEQCERATRDGAPEPKRA